MSTRARTREAAHLPVRGRAARAGLSGDFRAADSPGLPAGAGSALLRLQRDYGNRYVQGVVDASLQREIEGSRRGGRALDYRTAAELGGALGRDVSHVRVHDDSQADRLSRSLNAAAFTIGSDIFFRARYYSPGTASGRRLLAHELAHVVQQEASPRTAHRYRLALADDPGERAADRAAEDMVLRGRAQPVTVPPRAPLIQRMAFIGPDPISAKRAELGYTPHEEPGGSRPEKKARRRARDVPKTRRKARRKARYRDQDAPQPMEQALFAAEDLPQPMTTVKIPHELGDLGTGQRNLAWMLVDYKSRYFLDTDELYGYALGETDYIGYVDREKVWARLPDKFLVLGESHDRTTVMDLVEAIGTKKYIYEAGTTRPSPYLVGPAKQTPEMEHQLEELLPKFVVGLIGVQRTLEPELKRLRYREPDWKSEIRGQRLTAERADPEARRREHKAEMAEWSRDWELRYRSREERGERKIAPGGGYVGQHKPSGGLSYAAPSKPYDRGETEVRVTLQALRAVRDMAHRKKDPIAYFYAQYHSVIDKTIAQLEEGLPIELTRMFLKMATAKFDLERLIDLLSSAATQELADLNLANVKTHPSYAPESFKTPAETGAEELRDSYMLHRIIDAKEKGYRLAGLGDAHRKRLQGVLQAMDAGILVQSSDDFYVDQYRSHPDRG